MRAGQLRNRISIEARAIAQDSFGDGKPSWTLVATVWGSLSPMSGQENWQANQVRPDVTHTIRIRHYADLTPRHRLRIGTRIFGVESILDTDNRHRELVVNCREEV